MILVKMSYSVTEKIKLLLLQHNDPVTCVIPNINLIVRIRILMWFVFYGYSSFNSIYIYSYVFVFNYLVYSSLM